MMPPPDITYFLEVQDKIANSKLSARDLIVDEGMQKYGKNSGSWLQIDNDLKIYRQQERAYLASYKESAAGKRQKHINSLYFWMWVDESIRLERMAAQTLFEQTINLEHAQKLDEANKKFLNDYCYNVSEFLKKYQNGANTLFGIYASTNTTIMVTQKILIAKLGFTLLWPIAVMIVGLSVFNICLDKFLFDAFDESLSLNAREGIKLFLLILVALISFLVGYFLTLAVFYTIPVVLLLFLASYFINSMLQNNTLAGTVMKIFYTQDENGIPSWFEGFKKFNSNGKEFELTNRHLFSIKAGAFFSIVYAMAVAGVFAKWVLPVIATLGVMAWPVTIIVCAGLVLYVTIYGLLTTQAWADLMQADIESKERNGFGIFSLDSVKILGIKILIALLVYTWGVLDGLSSFLNNSYICVFGSDKITRSSAFLNILSLLGQLCIGIMKLCLRAIVIAISVFAPYGMYNTLYSGCEKIAGSLFALIVTPVTCLANAPFVGTNAIKGIVPQEENPDPKSGQATGWNWRILFYQTINSLCNSLLPNKGEIPSNADEGMMVFGAGGLSFGAGFKAGKNFEEVSQKKSDLLVKMWPNILAKPTTLNQRNSKKFSYGSSAF